MYFIVTASRFVTPGAYVSTINRKRTGSSSSDRRTVGVRDPAKINLSSPAWGQARPSTR